MTVTPVPHVSTLYAPRTEPALQVPHANDLGDIAAYLLDDAANAHRHGYFHGSEIVRLWPPLLPGTLHLGTIPQEVSAGMAADRCLITWRKMLRGAPVNDPTNVPNPVIEATTGGAQAASVFGLVADWVSLPILPAGEWQGHPALRPMPEYAATYLPLSDICNPLVECWRLGLAIDLQPDAKGSVHRALRDSIAAWTPHAIDHFNEQVGFINAAIAAITERKHQ